MGIPHQENVFVKVNLILGLRHSGIKLVCGKIRHYLFVFNALDRRAFSGEEENNDYKSFHWRHWTSKHMWRRGSNSTQDKDAEGRDEEGRSWTFGADHRVLSSSSSSSYSIVQVYWPLWLHGCLLWERLQNRTSYYRIIWYSKLLLLFWNKSVTLHKI